MRNRLTDELAVCGLNTVKALGEIHPERINRLFLREERLPLFSPVCKNLAERKRPYKICGDEELERICKTSHHQGIAAMIFEPSVEGASEEDLSALEGKTAILLCGVGNDHNLGAIVRSAAFFDVPLIIITEGEKEKILTTSAYRVAEGGMEHVEFRSVRNPAAFLRSASKSLVSIGTDPRARIRIRDLPKLIKNQKGIILALGNEETGLPGEIKEHCTLLARIPGTGAIESLNVSQAAALFLQELYER